MKFFRFALNVWITAASLLSFLLGWVALAHSPKPIQPSQTVAISALRYSLCRSCVLVMTRIHSRLSRGQRRFSQRPVFRTGGS